MKKFISILCLSLFFTIGYTQTNKTKIEDAVFTKGSLFKQEVYSVDNIAAFRLDAIKVTNLEKLTTHFRFSTYRSDFFPLVYLYAFSSFTCLY